MADERRFDDAAPKAAFPLRRTKRIVATVTGLLVPLAAVAIWNAVAHRTESASTQVVPPSRAPSALATPARASSVPATALLPVTLPAPSSIGAAATADAGASPLDAGARRSAPHHGSRPAAPPAPAPASSHDPLSDWLERSK
jgi:hypothetical protein